MINVEAFCCGFIGCFMLAAVAFTGGWTCGNIWQMGNIAERDAQILQLQTQLSDPHHCVSVCVEEFEKMGC